MASAKLRPICLGLNVLTHYRMTTHILVKNVSDNGLLRDSTKPLPESMLTQDYQHPCLFNFAGNVQDIVVKIMLWNNS